MDWVGGPMRTLIVTGGEAEGLTGPNESFDLVIAADSGFDQASALEVKVDLVVGDFDSISPQAKMGLAKVSHLATEVHPRDKEHSDLELALEAALVRGTTEVVVLGGGGGRLDHLLINAAVLTNPQFRPMRIRWETGRAAVHVVWDRTTVNGRIGDLVSLLAYGGEATGVSTSGLRWALRSARLSPATSRGLSNELVEDHARVTVATGTVLVIHTPL